MTSLQGVTTDGLLNQLVRQSVNQPCIIAPTSLLQGAGTVQLQLVCKASL